MFYLTIDGVRIPGNYFDEGSARNAAENLSLQLPNFDKRVAVADDDGDACAFKNGERCA